MKDPATWIVLANERSAQICVSHKGATHRIKSLDSCAAYSFGWLPASAVADPYDPQLMSGMSHEQMRRYRFGCEIVLDLMCHVKAEHCDGIVIVATAKMAAALRMAIPVHLSQFLISEIEMAGDWQVESDAELNWAMAS